MSLSDLIKAKQGALSQFDLATAIGVSVVSLSAVLAGKSSPNKSTAAKYASYLGIPDAEVQALGKAAKKAPRKTKPGPKAGPKPVKKAAISMGEIEGAIAVVAKVLSDPVLLQILRADKQKVANVLKLLEAK